MDRFEGFTDEDIKVLAEGSRNEHSDQKLTQINDSTVNAVYKQRQNKSRFQNRLSRKNVTREKLRKGILSKSGVNDSIPNDARLYIPQIVEEEENSDENNQTREAKVKKEPDLIMVTERTPTTIEIVDNCNVKETDKEMAITTKSMSVLNSEITNVDSLEEFENRQKLMEEQNRQRKEILRRALADRAKKTKEEVKRLNEIEGELKKLDVLLSNDVAIIRNQIETASIDFMVAQKRYDQAEKEFLDAKLDLFNRKERKELLTSHLCTIIEQNEMRKAKKLSDLMMQLEMGPKESLIASQIKVEYVNDESHESEKDVVAHESNATREITIEVNDNGGV